MSGAEADRHLHGPRLGPLERRNRDPEVVWLPEMGAGQPRDTGAAGKANAVVEGAGEARRVLPDKMHPRVAAIRADYGGDLVGIVLVHYEQFPGG